MSVKPEADRPSVIDLGDYLDGLYSYALILSRSLSDAEDLVQETCLRAIKSKDRLATDSNVKSRIFTMLRNIWLCQAQKSPSTRELKFDQNRPSNTRRNSHTAYVQNAKYVRVRAAIQQLPVSWREIIILRIYEGFSYQEISAIVGYPVGTVMSRLSKARQRLRQLLLCADGDAE